MKLNIHNIGKIERAEIELNGITVIAGANNTGKSTVGKTLYSVFSTFHNLEEKIINEKKDAISRAFSSLLREFYFKNILLKDDDVTIDEDKFYTEILLLKDESVIEDNLRRFCNSLDEEYSEWVQDEDIIVLTKRISNILGISAIEVTKRIIDRVFEIEFSGQVNNIFLDTVGEIEIVIKNDSLGFTVENNKVREVKNVYNLNHNIIYIDDPFILDEPRKMLPVRRRRGLLDHKDNLRKFLFGEYDGNLVGEIIVDNQLNDIYEKINTVCSGEFVKIKDFGYKKSNSDRLLNVKNISAGLKTFVIIKTLLKKEVLEHNGIIILDEPEVHLHPQWQLILAELIVLIQKHFDMNILLNTHSPYFLKAIEVYSSKHEIADKCKYYLAHNENELSYIDDVTENPDKIYALLAKPLQDLENVRLM